MLKQLREEKLAQAQSEEEQAKAEAVVGIISGIANGPEIKALHKGF